MDFEDWNNGWEARRTVLSTKYMSISPGYSAITHIFHLIPDSSFLLKSSSFTTQFFFFLTI